MTSSGDPKKEKFLLPIKSSKVPNEQGVVLRRRGRETNGPSSDEGLTLETSAFNLFTVANLRYQLS